jgi:hypothetical protein
MNFTNTDCVGKNWSRYKAFSRFTWQVPNQVDKQVKWEVDDQINPIKYKTKKEINK